MIADPLTKLKASIDEATENVSPFPASFVGRGIVVWAGGTAAFTSAWILVQCLRHAGCELPVEFWHIGRHGDDGIDLTMESLVAPLGVRCLDAGPIADATGIGLESRQQRKLLSIICSDLLEVLLLDAENLPVRDPSFLFEDPDYQAAGALFWQGMRQDPPNQVVWRLLNIPYRPEPEVDLGQVLIHKEVCWEALALAKWVQGNLELFGSDVFRHQSTQSRYEVGTSLFKFAWQKVGLPFVFPIDGPQVLTVPGAPPDSAIVCQPDLDGNRLFQKRFGLLGWRLFGKNHWVSGSMLEPACRKHLRSLESRWAGRVGKQFSPPQSAILQRCSEELLAEPWAFEAALAEEESPPLNSETAPDALPPQQERGVFDSVESSADVLYRRTYPGAFIDMKRRKVQAAGKQDRPLAAPKRAPFEEIKFCAGGRLDRHANAFLTFWELSEDGGRPCLTLRGDREEVVFVLRRINRRLWTSESCAGGSMRRVSLRTLARVCPASAGGLLLGKSIDRVRSRARKRLGEVVRVGNSSPEMGDHIISLYAAVSAVQMGLTVEFHTRFGKWMSRLRQPGLKIIAESPEKEADFLETGLIDLHADPVNQTYGVSRSRWYANAFWPGLAPRRPENLDREIKVQRFDFPSYILLAPRSRLRMVESPRGGAAGARIAQHLPPPPPTPQPVPHDWPTPHWQRLVEQLKEMGHEVIGIGMPEDEEFLSKIFGSTTAFWVTNQEPEWFIDAMLGCTAVVANDNGMADLAGFLRVPVVGLHAHFPSAFLWDCAEVTSVASDTACTFCHTKTDLGFSGVCNSGCSAVATISPDRVSAAVRALLDSAASNSCQT